MIHRYNPRQDMMASVPIGKAAAEHTDSICWMSLATLSIGVPGEMYIGGASVGRGYLKRPELTEQRFVANPSSR